MTKGDRSMFLFAETENIPGVVWGAIGAAVATIIAAAVAGIIKLSRNRHIQGRAERKDTIDEWRAILEAKSIEINELRAEQHKIRGEMQLAVNRESMCREELARTRERLLALEEALTAAGIKFRPWQGSDTGKFPKSPEEPK